jgi:hypothetical protein
MSSTQDIFDLQLATDLHDDELRYDLIKLKETIEMYLDGNGSALFNEISINDLEEFVTNK